LSDHACDLVLPRAPVTNAAWDGTRHDDVSYAHRVSDDWLARGSTASDDVRRYYDDLAASYDATLDSWGYAAPVHVAQLVMAALDGSGGGLTVLDAGCGTGLAGQALRDAGFAGRLLGVDLSPSSVALAAERGIYDEVVEGDLQGPLAYADHSVDLVVCVGVLTYVPDVAGIWGEFCRVTRPGGMVALTQRHDVWAERRCDDVLHDLERRGRWAVLHLSPPSSYLPGNAAFGDEILVRYLVARVRARSAGEMGSHEAS
jgi:predicted TPR repeat methyltransferase